MSCPHNYKHFVIKPEGSYWRCAQCGEEGDLDTSGSTTYNLRVTFSNKFPEKAKFSERSKEVPPDDCDHPRNMQKITEHGTKCKQCGSYRSHNVSESGVMPEEENG